MSAFGGDSRRRHKASNHRIQTTPANFNPAANKATTIRVTNAKRPDTMISNLPQRRTKESGGGALGSSVIGAPLSKKAGAKPNRGYRGKKSATKQ
jgi:hypothetical protein